jgi:hypothetical protein
MPHIPRYVSRTRIFSPERLSNSMTKTFFQWYLIVSESRTTRKNISKRDWVPMDTLSKEETRVRRFWFTHRDGYCFLEGSLINIPPVVKRMKKFSAGNTGNHQSNVRFKLATRNHLREVAFQKLGYCWLFSYQRDFEAYGCRIRAPRVELPVGYHSFENSISIGFLPVNQV